MYYDLPFYHFIICLRSLPAFANVLLDCCFTITIICCYISCNRKKGQSFKSKMLLSGSGLLSQTAYEMRCGERYLWKLVKTSNMKKLTQGTVTLCHNSSHLTPQLTLRMLHLSLLLLFFFSFCFLFIYFLFLFISFLKKYLGPTRHLLFFSFNCFEW